MNDTKKVLHGAEPKLLKTVTGKILAQHLIKGVLKPGEEIGIRVDQTLTQDATGTVAYLEAEVLGINRAKTELSVSYIDHNTLKMDHKNADDHVYLQSVAAKYGLILSKAGNGICHQVHLERFAQPGKTLLGSDSHTPTAGGIGCMGIGAGGLDVALAIGGEPFFLKTPKVIGIKLTGRLKPMVAAKDVILEVLRILGVKGGVGKALEYFGPGIKTLSVPERATITNMGAETGATTSVFPSDEVTLDFLRCVGREEQWVRLEADEDVEYDEVIEINLDKLVPLIAKPHSPGNVVPVREVEGTKVDQVCIGSCTNSSFKDLVTAAYMLKGKRVNPEVSLTVSPGSMSVYCELAERGYLADLIAAGARILECTCGPCIGQGQAPRSGAVSVRTFNRNFKGRSGTADAQVYLSSVETAVSCALTGVITDPRTMGELREILMPEKLRMQNALIVEPPGKEEAEKVELIRGPNIKPIELRGELPEIVDGRVLIKLEDNISTDIIMPAGIYLPLRSNIPEYAKHVFEPVDPDFYRRAKEKNGGFVIAGENYGQGSSREHAALCPSYLGIKGVIAKSFARIHLANLINFGIIPLTFKNAEDYNRIDPDDELQIRTADLDNGDLVLKNLTKGVEIPVQHAMTSSEVLRIKAGGTLAYISRQNM
ncbi:MAG TPA: aconitate hydratase [Firmicutes bacterium]|jgi:aconitate hydratase|nr:aconitate hydratase [Bacillota bacterium]